MRRTKASSSPSLAACQRALAIALAVVASATAGTAQPLTVELPRSIVFPNYNRVPLGQREAFEGGAFVARTDDATAAWYNPAGLVRSEKSGLNASATAYEWTTFAVDGFGTTASRSRLSTMSTLTSGVIGAPVVPAQWRLGFAIARPVSWHPGALDETAEFVTDGGQEHFSFKALSDLSTQVVRVSVGWQPGSRLRLGAGVGLAWTSLSLDQGISDLFVTPDSTTTLARRLHTEGTTHHLVGTFGVQWDLHPRWNAGACLSTPGLRLTGTSQVTYEASRASSAANAYLAFRDEDTRFEYRLPLELTVGLAYSAGRGSLEADLRWHDGTSSYDIYTTDVVGKLTVDRDGQPVAVSEAAFAATSYQARSVLNLAIGGRYQLSRGWTIHGGIFADQSPVASSDNAFFPRIDFLGGTLGATLSGDHLSGSFGVGFTSGSSEEVPVLTLIDDETTTSQFEVRTISLNYAVSYAF